MMSSDRATNRSTVVGVFHDNSAARRAIEALKDGGFDGDQISVLTPDREETRAVASETETRAGEDAAKGAVAGGILGGLGGWLVGIGALAIPGVGPFIAAGAIATAIGGAAIGAGVGAIAGALVGMGVPQEEADYYEGEVKSGRTLVTVRADSRYDEAQRIMRQHGAYDIESGAPDRNVAAGSSQPVTHAETSSATAGRMPVTGAAERGRETNLTDQRTMQLREEELRARKSEVESGEVTIGKDVVTEQRSIDVPVTREEVTIERHPVDRRPSDQPISDRGETIEVPVREERVEVTKEPVVYEEVAVGKRQVTETERVSETVRREEARIDQQGSADVRGWDEAMPQYRAQWQQRYGNSGSTWEADQPAYRYGHDLRSQPEYRGRSWTDVEPTVRQDWERRNPDKPWDRAREAIRETWEDKTR